MALNEQNRVLFIQIQMLPPSMQHKWEEIIEILCKTTNGKVFRTESQQKFPLNYRITLVGPASNFCQNRCLI